MILDIIHIYHLCRFKRFKDWEWLSKHYSIQINEKLSEQFSTKRAEFGIIPQVWIMDYGLACGCFNQDHTSYATGD